MSEHVQQFVAMVRQAYHQQGIQAPSVRRFCEQCSKLTAHKEYEVGEWEYHRCQVCGKTKNYRVR